MGRFRRFIVEYIGNVHFSNHAERRADWRSRELMDWVVGQMEVRSLEAAQRHELVRDIREVMKPGDPVSTEVSRDEPN